MEVAANHFPSWFTQKVHHLYKLSDLMKIMQDVSLHKNHVKIFLILFLIVLQHIADYVGYLCLCCPGQLCRIPFYFAYDMLLL